MALKIPSANGNMYNWVDRIWNPIKGECGFGCTYCYTHRWGKQKPIHFDKKEFLEEYGAGNLIFVCSGCDLFHPDVPMDWIGRVFYRAIEWDIYTGGANTYLWHTKNPSRFLDAISKYHYPENSSVLCVTVESNRFYDQMNFAPMPSNRLLSLAMYEGRKMITIEPIMDFDLDDFVPALLSCHPEQVNIGADSGRNGLTEPPAEKIEELIARLIEAGVKVINLKKNLKRLMPGYVWG
jgi:DNA repair photolyase